MNLPPLVPGAARTARIHARCHERLAQQRREQERRDLAGARIERALVTGLAVIYIAAVTVNVLSVFTVF